MKNTNTTEKQETIEQKMKSRFAPGWDTSELTYFPGAIKFADVEKFVSSELQAAVQKAREEMAQEIVKDIELMYPHKNVIREYIQKYILAKYLPSGRAGGEK